MPNEKKPKTKYVEYLRHAEYYDMQSTFDELYARSQAGEIFDGLMDVILSRENILLAYRNIKSNTGSFTPGTDKLKISDIGKLTADEVTARVRRIVKGGKNGYTPRSVRRKEIPKPNGSTRPLGIPCIWDRLVQQCIKQVMEPICEARFSNNSYGFRPNRSVENAIAAIYRLMQRSGLYYVVEFDIKGFFDNVDHSKLIKQLWSLNIRDKELLYVIRRILKAPILMPDGHIEHPAKGTPQGGIISPLLANVVLNELDHWIESQWQCNPVTENYSYRENATGCPIQSHAYPVISKDVARRIRYARKGGTWALCHLNGLNRDGTPSKYNERYMKWRILLDAPFFVSDQCCFIMKERPLHRYNRETGRKQIIATMACESARRQSVYLKIGCNAYHKRDPTSQPMSFWTEQDVLEYLRMTGIPYASVYGEIVEENGRLTTTGAKRTGCMFCMFGVHLEKPPNRFQRMALTHPKQYDFCIHKLGCGKVLDFLGVPYAPNGGEVT